MVNVANLSKTFKDQEGGVQVLCGASFSIENGEMVALVGVSGAGKTTLLQILGGLDRATSGSVEIAGRELSSMTPRQTAEFRNRSIGFVFQFHHLLPDFTALENVFIPGLIGGKERRECELRARELLEEFGLSRRLTHYPSELSGGERQRVALARAMYNKPDLVLADEPTGNLDRENSEQMLQMLIKANREFGQTFLVATHNQRIAEGMRRTLFLDDGKVVPDDQRAAKGAPTTVC